MSIELSFITDEASQNICDSIEIASNWKLASVELRTVKNRKVAHLCQRELQDLSKQIQDAGLGVCCLDSDVFKCDIDQPLHCQLDELKRWCDAGHHVGCEKIRVFTFWRRVNPKKYAKQIEEYLNRANDVAQACGIQLLVENGRRTMHCTASEMADLFANLPRSMQILWDPANSIFGGWTPDPLDDFDKITDRVAHVHVKDAVYVSDVERSYVPIGSGSLGIARLLKLLLEANYHGILSLETHWRIGRIIDPQLLDNPGGDAFSFDGMPATESSLSFLANLLSGFRHVS
jgi:L-ribulose-5-phosphate 3-epimerase